MIEKIQVSSEKFRRANCKKCKIKIMPLKVRGVVQGGMYDGYLCEKCTEEELNDIPKRLKKVNNKFNKLIKMDVEEKRDYLRKLNILKELNENTG